MAQADPAGRFPETRCLRLDHLIDEAQETGAPIRDLPGAILDPPQIIHHGPDLRCERTGVHGAVAPEGGKAARAVPAEIWRICKRSGACNRSFGRAYRQNVVVAQEESAGIRDSPLEQDAPASGGDGRCSPAIPDRVVQVRIAARVALGRWVRLEHLDETPSLDSVAENREPSDVAAAAQRSHDANEVPVMQRGLAAIELDACIRPDALEQAAYHRGREGSRQTCRTAIDATERAFPVARVPEIEHHLGKARIGAVSHNGCVRATRENGKRCVHAHARLAFIRLS